MANSTFKKQMVSGVFYTAIAKYSGMVISLGVTMVLSRILTPSDFGVVAIATIFMSFFAILCDLGLGAAIIQKRELTADDLSSLFSFTVYLGLGLGFVLFLSSWGISYLYRNEMLISICQLLAINVFFSTLNIVPNALMMRDKRFKFIAIRTFVVQALVGVVSVFVALYGAGVYALLVNPIVGSAIIFIVTYRQKPLAFRLIFDKLSLLKVASYSFYQFSFSFINYFTRNLDKLLIGRAISLTSLGYYEKSYRLMMLPLQNITYVVTPVMHPILSDYQDDILDVRNKFTVVIRWLAIIGFPFSVYLFFSAKELILLAFGSQWLPSVTIFRILSLTVWCQIIGSANGVAFQVTNQMKSFFYVGLINTIVNVAGMLVGTFVFGTAEAVAWMMVVTFYIGLWNFWYVARYIFHSSVMMFVKACIPALKLSAIMSAIMLLFSFWIEGMSLWLSLACKTTICGVIFIGTLHFTKMLTVQDIYKLVRNRMNIIRS